MYSSPLAAQTVSQVRATADSSVVTILYDLQGTIEGQLYQVELYSSHNAFSTPLQYVYGEVGNNIQAGKDKKIIWQTKELMNYEGEVSFDVRALLTFSPFMVKSPRLSAAYKRGKAYPVEWVGGIPSEKVKLELYRNNVKIEDISQANNKGTHQWLVNHKARPGRNYQIRISSEEKPENNTRSSNFTIKRKIPLLVKVLPLAGLAAGAYLILGKDKPTPLVTPASKWLPEPDKPQ
jgi:hypothetical protein